MRIQGSDEHETLVHDLRNVVDVGLNANDTILRERRARIAQKSCGSQRIGNYHRLKDVEFKVSVAASDGGRYVVAHDLSRDHGDSFALSRIYFSGHDGTAGFVLRKGKFTEATSRTAAEESNVVGDLNSSEENVKCEILISLVVIAIYKIINIDNNYQRIRT